MAGSPLKRHKKVLKEADEARAKRVAAKAKKIAGKPKPAPGTKQTSGTNYIRTDAPPVAMEPQPHGGVLRRGGTSKGGSGRTPKAVQESFARLVDGAGRVRLAEILLARPRKVPQYDDKGKFVQWVYFYAPAKDDTVIRAVETAARIAGLTQKIGAPPADTDLPALHIGVDPPLEGDEG